LQFVKTVYKLIAQRAGVNLESISPAYIRAKREIRNDRLVYDRSNDYGGQIHDGLEHLSDRDIEMALQSYDHFEELEASN